MDTKTPTSFWWLKPSAAPAIVEDKSNLTSTPQIELDISSSLQDFLDKEQNIDREASDIASIIEEINRVAAQSPLGPYENAENPNVEEIMREAERIFLESSKSFEQLSSRSRTSQNVTEIGSHSSKQSTPTPKSVSPLPLDVKLKESDVVNESDKESDSESDEESYTDDFSRESDVEVKTPSPKSFDNENVQNVPSVVEINKSVLDFDVEISNKHREVAKSDSLIEENALLVEDTRLKEDIFEKEEVIRKLQLENDVLRKDVNEMQVQLKEASNLLAQTKQALSAKVMQSPEINLELEKTLEELKDTKELNTGLQLQLDGLNKTHQMLKISYEELLSSNKNLERHVAEIDATLAKYKTELINAQKNRDKLIESETNLGKLLEVEKLKSKSLQIQNEKDAKCIKDLNRQIKEMERIITRKHPDSVSALIVAAKGDAADSNLTARKVLEDRIKTLENEALTRDAQSSKIFLEVQEKFNQMKLKYESHIEDLELHVTDLKNQLKRKVDTYDVYTQTSMDDQSQKIPEKETCSRSVQTDGSSAKINQAKPPSTRRTEKASEAREETHLLATIRGLQTDLSNKEKSVAKLQKELEEMRNTNRRLQKEREGSLRNLSDRKEFRSFPEKLALQSYQSSSSNELSDRGLEDELRAVRTERDKMKLQLCRIEADFQALKTKRLQDLTALQEAHEREIATYLSNIAPLREQLEVQQVSITTLQTQLSATKEELAVVTVERDHLNNRLNSLESLRSFDVGGNGNCEGGDQVEQLHKKIVCLEKRYEERENRLRAIVHGLAQKNITNRSCEQCAARQQQLIGYKVELDQILATLRSLQ